ncbi:STOREKEEPER protein-like [Zingiber officinale]|uniref:Glabrous enhancer-binding protein-like DBD domain-containing protein n=1 Tax=Zingiber officinale TaxID=94328 RepID=A0A8J5FRA6_ZINOF|nr:STOREKEEPER protein-like [Zingiber officinale]KAG6494443.1 hypothetical protein ZIOFF_049469 [Zingiber officinale]
MAPKRAATAKPESSTSGSDDESASGTGSSSSEEEEPQRKEEVRPPSPSHKKNPVVPPVPSSDEEEEDGSDEEEEGDGSEEEEEDDSGDEDPKSSGLQTTKGPPPPPRETLPKPTSDESSDGSGSDSESSDESPPTVPAPRPSRAAEPSIKPITTKPMDAPSNPVNQVSPSPSLDQGSLKRKRESVGSPQSGQKRQSFQRLWGLDDELILLNGLAEFRSKNGYAPSSNHEMEVIRELIKDSFRLVVSDSQLNDKIRRLKKKFQTNAARAKNGVDPVLSNAHEQEAYAISKKVWGSEKFTSVNGNDNVSANSESEGNEEERGNEIGQKSKDDANYAVNGGIVKAHYPFLWETANKMADELPCGVGIKMALEMLDNAKAKALEDKLEKLIMSKTRMHMRRINLSKETVKLLLDSVAKSE